MKLFLLVILLALSFAAAAQSSKSYNGNLAIQPDAFRIAFNAALEAEGAAFRANAGTKPKCEGTTCNVIYPLSDAIIMSTITNKSDGSVRVILLLATLDAKEADMRIKMPQAMRGLVKAVTPMIPIEERTKAVDDLTGRALKSKDMTGRYIRNGVRYIFGGIPGTGMMFTVQREDGK